MAKTKPTVRTEKAGTAKAPTVPDALKATSGWAKVGGILTSKITAVQRGANQIDCFARSISNVVYRCSYNGPTWTVWKALASTPMISNIAAVSRDGASLDCFARGTDNRMYHNPCPDGVTFKGWTAQGGTATRLTSDIAAVFQPPNQIYCFARGTDHQLKMSIGTLTGTVWSWTAWNNPGNLGGVIEPEISAVSWRPGLIHVFARAIYGAQAWVWWGYDSSWQQQGLGGGFAFASGISAFCWEQGTDRIDYVGVGKNGRTLHGGRTSAGWFGPQEIDLASNTNPLNPNPTAISWAQNRLDFFGRGPNANVMHGYWTPNSWKPWENLAGGIVSDVTAVCWPGQQRIDLLGLTADGAMWHNRYTP